jgi:hypothetical protein
MSNPKELTLGELRLALARGSNEQTVREALEAIREDDAVAARHEQATAAYRAYVEERRRRLQAAEEEAMDEADREQQRTGRPWDSREARYSARRKAGLEARERFELDEPLLEFSDWAEAGSPERYQAKTPAARRKARIDLDPATRGRLVTLADVQVLWRRCNGSKGDRITPKPIEQARPRFSRSTLK